jgi:catechol 2,3-dioxygenase-like lactoylglutathione lyase family enzyme
MTKRTLVCGVHPVLPAADVARTALFYEQQLGFVTAFRHGEPPKYVGVLGVREFMVRDPNGISIEIHEDPGDEAC